jgi:hypothetical protein
MAAISQRTIKVPFQALSTYTLTSGTQAQKSCKPPSGLCYFLVYWNLTLPFDAVDLVYCATLY